MGPHSPRTQHHHVALGPTGNRNAAVRFAVAVNQFPGSPTHSEDIVRDALALPAGWEWTPVELAQSMPRCHQLKERPGKQPSRSCGANSADAQLLGGHLGSLDPVLDLLERDVTRVIG